MANYNPNLVKINRSYSFEELAEVFGIHKNTISTWVKNGLPCLKERRPFLVLGAEAKAYLKERRRRKKQRCSHVELYCVRCKQPKFPYGGMVDYEPCTDTKGRLIGLCPSCSGIINKFASLASLEQIYDELDVTILRAQ